MESLHTIREPAEAWPKLGTSFMLTSEVWTLKGVSGSTEGCHDGGSRDCPPAAHKAHVIWRC